MTFGPRELVFPRGAAGQVLTHDGTRWVAGAATGGGGSYLLHSEVEIPGVSFGGINTIDVYRTWPLPADTVASTEGLRIRTLWTFPSGSSSTRTFQLFFDGTQIRSVIVNTTNIFALELVAEVYRCSSPADDWRSVVMSHAIGAGVAGTQAGEVATATADWTAAIDIEVKGAFASLGSIIRNELFTVEHIRP